MKKRPKQLRIVLGSGSLAQYPQGGGHWSAYLQYLLALRALGHDVFLLELLLRCGRPEVDRRRISIFLGRLDRLGFRQNRAVLLHDLGQPPLLIENNVYGSGIAAIKQTIRNADILWNFHCSIRPPLLHEFKYKALLDLDPGHLQISALSWDLGLDAHDVFFSVGSKINDNDCGIPRLGHQWQPFFPPVFLPTWDNGGSPGDRAPVTSITQWNWGDDLPFNGEVLSSSKRKAHLRFLDLPRRCSANFVLAANIHPRDNTGDRELLIEHDWAVVHPHHCTQNMGHYRRFIQGSLAEFGCAKSVYTALRTGWFSDRSAAYLASGRPVVAEDTGFRDHLPTGTGLLTFATINEAATAIDDLLTNYGKHQKAAREIAEAFLNAQEVLWGMLDLSQACERLQM